MITQNMLTPTAAVQIAVIQITVMQAAAIQAAKQAAKQAKTQAMTHTIAAKPAEQHLDRQSQIKALLNQGQLWKASHSISSANSDNSQNVINTGFSQIDSQLAYGGWPLGQLIECLLPNQITDDITQVLGLLYLFIPAIRKTSQNDAPVLLVAPPYIPYLPGWLDQSVNQAPNNIWALEIEKSSNSIKERLWATEQALRSNACSVVICWLDQSPQPGQSPQLDNSSQRDYSPQPDNSHRLDNSRLPTSALRKLQLAARRSQSLFITVRNDSVRHQASPAPLRIALDHVEKAVSYSNTSHASQTCLQVNILKQPGSWGGQQITLNWHKTLQQGTPPPEQWPVHHPDPINSHAPLSQEHPFSRITSPQPKTSQQ